MAVRVFGAGGKRRKIAARQIKQCRVDIPPRGADEPPIAGIGLPPGGECALAFLRCAVGFITDNDVSGGQLVAKVVIGHYFFVQQLARIQHA